MFKCIKAFVDILVIHKVALQHDSHEPESEVIGHILPGSYCDASLSLWNLCLLLLSPRRIQLGISHILHDEFPHYLRVHGSRHKCTAERVTHPPVVYLGNKFIGICKYLLQLALCESKDKPLNDHILQRIIRRMLQILLPVYVGYLSGYLLQVIQPHTYYIATARKVHGQIFAKFRIHVLIQFRPNQSVHILKRTALHLPDLSFLLTAKFLLNG